MHFLAILSIIIVKVIAGVTVPGISTSTVADMAVAFEKEMLPIKLPRPFYQKLINKITKAPPKIIKSYQAKSFFMGDFDIRVTEDFLNAHYHGIPPASYHRNILWSKLKEAEFEVPHDLKSWKYGESRTLKTHNKVKFEESFRNSRGNSWQGAELQEKVVAVKATRYRGEKLNDGKHGKDIFLIEEILPFPTPKFQKGAISGLIIDETPVFYDGVPTFKVPTVYVNGIPVEVRGTERFINNHVLGNPGPEFSDKYLFVFPVDSHAVLKKADIKSLRVGVPGVVNTEEAFTLSYTRNARTGVWERAKTTPYTESFHAVLYDSTESDGISVLVLKGSA